MRIFILGAGFSQEAGYPLSRDLFRRLRENQSEMEKKWANPPQPWQDFVSWWNNQSSWLPLFFPQFRDMKDVDIELLLTLMDLRLDAIEKITNESLRQWSCTIRNGTITTPEESEEAVQHASEVKERNEPLTRARDALREALALLIERISMETPVAGVDYIRDFSNHLEGGDIVITFNYDVELEKALIASSRWHFDDGYGLPIKIFRYRGVANDPQTPVSLLKLHGSIGWRQGPDGRLKLESPLASYLEPSIDEGTDSSIASPFEFVDSKRIMIEPSYLKVFYNPDHAKIWAKAAEALSVCSKVTVIGYSFPQADMAVRALIASSLSLREEVPVTVIDTSPQPKMILSNLLSREVSHLQTTAKQWLQELKEK